MSISPKRLVMSKSQSSTQRLRISMVMLRGKSFRISLWLIFFASTESQIAQKNYYLAETSILKNFKPLLNDFPRTPYFIPDSWTLDVIQLWIGAGGQITPSHNDEAENILCQFQGGRTFYVYDPFWVDLLYTSAENPVYPRVKVRETTPNYKNYPLFRKARAPLELRINEGECLYLPSTWYHRVESKPDTRSLAINYWYHPQSSIGELLWVSMSSHEWATAEGELKMGRKRGEQN
mmetsp:Transcript_395/g.1508  ORF Transcript_395/g.1508 Transcript_395/m.1508 type:complete len:235 (-) Transcript_395:942-1646(-)